MTTNELTEVLRAFAPKEHSDSFGPAEWIAVVAAAAAVIATIIAFLALAHSKLSAISAANANILAERIAKRAGVIELHQAWQGVNRFDSTNPVYPDAIRGANAIELTASLWNHDVLEKEILFQSYWKAFRDIYASLSRCSLTIPSDGRRICDMISPAVTLAYKQMEALELQRTPQTTMTRS